MTNVLSLLQVPTSNGYTQSDNQDLQQLQSAYGQQFDVQFMRMQVQDHVKDVRDMTQHYQNTSNEMIRGLIANTLPILRQHLALAEAVDRYVNQGQQQGCTGAQR